MERGFAAWNAGDMAAVRELWDPVAILRPPDGWPEPGPFTGRDAIFRQFQQMRETWKADALEPITSPVGVGDRVVLRFSWRGAGHGPDVDMQMSVVYSFRAGKIVGADFFWDHSDALEAVAAQR